MKERLSPTINAQIIEQLETAADNFDAEMQALIQRYYQVIPETIKPRGPGFLRWSYVGSNQLLLSCVPSSCHTTLACFNTIAVLLNAMIDDLADLVQCSELVMVALAQLQFEQPLSSQSIEPYREYLQLIYDIRVYLVHQSQWWASWEQWRPALKHFLKRYQLAMLESIKHNQRMMSSDPALFWIDLDRYILEMSPPIHTGLFALFNLMISAPAPQSEIATINYIFRLADQYMVMANWMATWQEEIAERDYSSGVIIFAIEQGFLKVPALTTLSASDLQDVIQAAHLEQAFFMRMKGVLGAIQTLAINVSHFDVKAYADALHRVAWMHLEHKEMLKHGTTETSSIG